MTHGFALLGLLLLGVGSCLWNEYLIRQNLKPYRERRCTGAAWRRAFPDRPRQDIRKFLTMFAMAFDVRGTPILCFSPADRLMDVYNGLHPLPFMPDEMEVESFARDVGHEYAVDLLSIWRDDLTLGDVFRRTAPTVRTTP